MRYYGLSDTGKSRGSNQDAFVMLSKSQKDFLAVVCDGVGGANHGEVASATAIRVMKENYEESSPFLDLEDARAWLFTSVVAANDTVFKKAQKNTEYKGMGTTLVACLVCEFGVLVANVGDSRAYTLNEAKTFKMLTKDHTFVANLIQSGEISVQESLIHPQRHVITNAVGIWKKIEVDIYEVTKEITTIVLCSDGLHGYVGEDKVATVVKNEKMLVKTKVERLIQFADAVGGLDNVTVVIVELNKR